MAIDAIGQLKIQGEVKPLADISEQLSLYKSPMTGVRAGYFGMDVRAGFE